MSISPQVQFLVELETLAERHGFKVVTSLSVYGTDGLPTDSFAVQFRPAKKPTLAIRIDPFEVHP